MQQKTIFHTQNQARGFTLLELLVVMAILALLAGLGLRMFGTVQQKSRDTRRKQELQSITKALEAYHNDFKRYPSSMDGRIMGCGAGATEACAWGGVWQNTANETLYMSELPQDPGGNQYYYLSDAQGLSYSLFAYLENSEDASIVLNDNAEPAYYANTYCRFIDSVMTASTCNYIVRSSNAIDNPIVVDSY